MKSFRSRKSEFVKTSEIVKPLAKGQITIPSAFRKQLGIDENSLLDVSVKEGELIIKPLRSIPTKYLRSYTDSQIEGFLEEDKLNA